MSKRKTPITEEAQPKPTAELRREGRLARIAKALASGATVTDIAEAEGIGRTLASREANSPECRRERNRCVLRRTLSAYGFLPSIVLVLVSAPPALMATFTASSIGSLKGTSIRSRPCS